MSPLWSSVFNRKRVIINLYSSNPMNHEGKRIGAENCGNVVNVVGQPVKTCLFWPEAKLGGF